jgi:hypothetical protein
VGYTRNQKFYNGPATTLDGVWSLTKGPTIALLRETWTGEREAAPDLKQDIAKYLADLRDRLEVASAYANQHSQVEQNRYVYVRITCRRSITRQTFRYWGTMSYITKGRCIKRYVC